MEDKSQESAKVQHMLLSRKGALLSKGPGYRIQPEATEEKGGTSSLKYQLQSRF